MDIKKQEKKILIVFLISLIIYILFAFFGDIKKISAAFISFRWSIIPLLLILTLLNYLLRAVRFYIYLKEINVNLPFKKILRIFLAGLSMTITPGKSGEVIKAYLIKKNSEHEYAHVVPVLVFERVTDGIAMIILGLGGIFLLQKSILFFIFSGLFIALFIYFIKVKKHILKLIIFLEKKLPRIKILKFAEIFFANSQKLLTAKILLIGVGLAIVAWSFEGLILFFIISEFTKINVFYGISLAFFIFSFSSIAGFFVLIPGGIGVAEGSITYFLSTFIPLGLAQSVFITIIFRFITLWFGVCLGLFSLIRSFKILKNKNN